MNILSFAATNSSQSINKQLVSYASDILRRKLGAEAHQELLDLNDFDMPIYSIDREQDAGVPEQAHRFLAKVQAADFMLISGTAILLSAWIWFSYKSESPAHR